MSDLTLSTLVDVGKALGHPARLRMLALLQEGDLFVCQITAILGMAVSTVSAHLAVLRRAGLVREDKEGRWVRYRLGDDEPLASMAREVLYLVQHDPRIRSDLETGARIRRLPLDRVCGMCVSQAARRTSALGTLPASRRPRRETPGMRARSHVP
jgi:DNA-binding transcriptional ArsR family regulator